MAAISGFPEQRRKMNAVRVGVPFGLSVHGEKQLIGKIVLMNFSFLRKFSNEETERTPDSTVVGHKLLFGIGEAHDLRHGRVHCQIHTVERIQRGVLVFDQVDYVRKLGGNPTCVAFDPFKRAPLSMLIICTSPMHYRPQDVTRILISIVLNSGL